MATLSIHHYLDVIDSFVQNVTSTNKSYYLFVGRPEPWVNESNENDDTAVPVSNGSVYQHESSIYVDMAFGKLITENDIISMIPRYDWATETVYDRYDQFDGNLYNKKYFVVTDNSEVYKCIDNNDGEPSIYKPTLNLPRGVFETADGYIWKYMYTIDTNSNTKFSTSNYIPVIENPDVVNNAVNGSIDVIKTVTGGSNYRTYYTGFIRSVVNNYNVILNTDASHIDNFYTKSSIYLRSGYGSGQIRKIIYYNGENRRARLDSPFDTYIVFSIADKENTFLVGDVVTQNVDNITSAYTKGSFNIGDVIVQSDTGANGNIISSNTTVKKVIRDYITNDFQPYLPYRSLNDVDVQKSGTVSVKSFVELPVSSNSTAFTLGETVYQVNSTSETIATGILFSAVIQKSFNANVDVNGTEDFVTLANNPFVDGEKVIYSTATGNTPLSGFTNNSLYYVVQSNTTGIKLSTDLNSTANVNITASSISESGHYFTRTPLTLVIGNTVGTFVSNDSVNTVIGTTSTAEAVVTNVISNTGGRSYAYTSTSLVSAYPANSYIRIGENANNNIRRVLAANSTVLTMSNALSSNVSANIHYSVINASEPISISKSYSNGTVSNTNLNGVNIEFTDPTLFGLTYEVGETVNMVDGSNTNQGIYGTVGYANLTNVILTNVEGGEFLVDYYISGVTSLQKAKISEIVSYPTVTVYDPRGTGFLVGQRIFSRSATDYSVVHGSANVISYHTTPNELTELIISPTVEIDGDGIDAKAYTIVQKSNSTFSSPNNVMKVVVLDPGYGYTQANVTIVANSIHGSGAVVSPVISPARGHGYDAKAELGARYAGINVEISNGANEGHKFPVYGKYRRIGIIQDPLFDEVYASVDSFDRATLKITNVVGETDFAEGEVIYQPNSGFSGIITYVNPTEYSATQGVMEVRSIKGEFSSNGKFANSTVSNDNIIGLYTNTTANVYMANINYFTVASTVEIVSETKSNANAILITAYSNNGFVKLGSVSGRFDANDTMVDAVSNTYANVSGIYVANGNVEVTYSFGKKFNQTARIPLTSNTISFSQFEIVRQSDTLSSGVVISANNEYDIIYADKVGSSFNVNDVLTDQTTLSTGKVIFANSTYLRVTSSNGVFSNNSTIINNLGVTALSSNVFPTLVLSNVNGEFKFQVDKPFTGLTSGAIGNCDKYNIIVYPELIRDSGSVIYLENLEPFTLSNSSKETIKLVIKF